MIQELIQDSVGLVLKSINYESFDPKQESKITYTDSFTMVSKNKDIVEFEVSRKIIGNLQVGFSLNVSAGVQIYAKKGVDLNTQLTDEIIQENIIAITKTVMSFVSSLITQITGSFGNIPIVTAPALKVK